MGLLPPQNQDEVELKDPNSRLVHEEVGSLKDLVPQKWDVMEGEIMGSKHIHV